jgi:hypothetical protein
LGSGRTTVVARTAASGRTRLRTGAEEVSANPSARLNLVPGEAVGSVFETTAQIDDGTVRDATEDRSASAGTATEVQFTVASVGADLSFCSLSCDWSEEGTADEQASEKYFSEFHN